MADIPFSRLRFPRAPSLTTTLSLFFSLNTYVFLDRSDGTFIRNSAGRYAVSYPFQAAISSGLTVSLLSSLGAGPLLLGPAPLASALPLVLEPDTKGGETSLLGILSLMVGGVVLLISLTFKVHIATYRNAMIDIWLCHQDKPVEKDIRAVHLHGPQ